MENPAETGDAGEMADLVRVPSTPRAVSTEERLAHEASGHASYRNWCRFCVQGKARASAHASQANVPSELPEVVADFCEFPLPNSGSLKVLVMKDRMRCALVHRL